MSTDPTPKASEKSADQIWHGDLFNRREEAEILIRYIETVGQRPIIREDHRGFTLAVDAEYGFGKSFFLRRLAEHLRLSHPVAFIDAWVDDIADEPFTAIAATLKQALKPLMQSGSVDQKWSKVTSKSGEIAKIVAKGLAKKGLGLLITGAAAEAVEKVLTEIDAAKSGDFSEDIKDVGADASSGVIDEAFKSNPKSIMDSRISDFENGRKSIDDLKKSVSDLVDEVAREGSKLPIVIIIDELDRCRPTYAIKLLEEVTHLFDVTGIVFVFGINAEQLSHSISGVYGSGFDGQSYLRRFINRSYNLQLPDLAPLVEHLLNYHGISESYLEFLNIETGGTRSEHTASVMIAKYMKMYGFHARDAFSVIDVIQTCTAVVGQQRLFMPYLLPMIFGHIRGLKNGSAPPPLSSGGWMLSVYDVNASGYVAISTVDMFNRMKSAANWNMREIISSANSGDYIGQILSDYAGNARSGRFAPSAYEALVQKLAAFSRSTE
ncbi:hypothetical protein EON83_30460 [bacterium]|nr:MAG: hypothetical protein EON83_30460 [bacterium]